MKLIRNIQSIWSANSFVHIDFIYELLNKHVLFLILQLIVEKHYPKQAYVHPFSVQILRVLISLPEGKDLNVTLKVESEAFYLYACPTRVKFHSSDGVTIKSGSVPELVLG